MVYYLRVALLGPGVPRAAPELRSWRCNFNATLRRACPPAVPFAGLRQGSAADREKSDAARRMPDTCCSLPWPSTLPET
jgi:hypothetical protein